jgi:hypothetical protein
MRDATPLEMSAKGIVFETAQSQSKRGEVEVRSR